jgi:hypothetical protein
MKRSLIFVLLSLVFVSGVGLQADAVPAVHCGAVLVNPNPPKVKVFHLKHNLNCAPSFDPAIALGDDTTLDLGGHTLSGGGTGHGVDAIGLDHATVQNGSIKSFVTPVFFQDGNQDHATHLTLVGGAAEVNLNNTSHALVSNNKMKGIGLTCIEVNGADTSTVRSNKMSCSTNGIKIDNAATNTLVTRNKISAGTIGIDLNTTGPAFNRITGNRVRGGTTGIDVSGAAVDESITGNKITGASSDGIHVASGAQTIAIGGNSSNGNTHDGIFVQSSDVGTSVGDNVANDNGNYGIEATGNTDDAGGDRAKGNGQFFQCLFILCQ